MARSSLRDIRLQTADEVERSVRVQGPRATCDDCGAPLPKTVRRRTCVACSPYVQGIVHELMRRERRRQVRRAA